MRKYRLSTSALVLSGLALVLGLGSCAGIPLAGGPGSGVVSSAADVDAACFEIVTLKPQEDSLSYDKPLNWDLLNYRDRNDKYYTLGTAFAISDTELVTAAHVMTLSDDSPFIPQRFIRERRVVDGQSVEQVYEVDKIVSFDTKKDYVVFTVKDKRFDRWFRSSDVHPFNETVTTAGYAYGEGLAIRPGTLLEYMPEDDKGEWNLLKSSAPANPGNSGGPLFDAKMRVIGVVLSRRDNFCYSLPITEIEESRGRMYRKIGVGFVAFSNQLIEDLSDEYDMPMPYRKLMGEVSGKYLSEYNGLMDKLFASLDGEYFPDGESSRAALYRAASGRFPQIYLKASDDKQWFCTNRKASYADLDHDGFVGIAEAYDNARTWLISLKVPTTEDAGTVYGNPRALMDQVLRGINITRKLTDKDPGARITSYGEPMDSSYFNDRWGRKWRLDVWALEYMDRAVMTISAPTPEGATLAYTSCNASEINELRYDLKHIADLVCLSYVGTLKEWTAFLPSIPELAPQLGGLSLSWKEDNTFSISSDSISATAMKVPFTLSGASRLGLYYDVFPRKGTVVNAMRRFVLDDGVDDGAYMAVRRWLKPEGELAKGFFDDWTRLIEGQGQPYDGVPYLDSGKTNVAAVLPRAKGLPYALTASLMLATNIDSDKASADMRAIVSSLSVQE